MAFENVRADFARVHEVLEGSPLYRTLHALGTPGFHALLVYRFGRWALAQPALVRPVLGALYQLAYLFVRILWGIELSRGARIGAGLYIGHFGGICVSRRAVMGRNCTLSQGVTIGVSGDGASFGAPEIGDDVYIAPGARVFGPIHIGNNVKIGPNAVVGQDVPANAVLALEPGFRIVSYRGNRRAEPSTPSDKRRSASTG
jgi:serine O-acetyltransferase